MENSGYKRIAQGYKNYGGDIGRMARQLGFLIDENQTQKKILDLVAKNDGVDFTGALWTIQEQAIEIDRLTKYLNAAPHHPECNSRRALKLKAMLGLSIACDCWKAVAP